MTLFLHTGCYCPLRHMKLGVSFRKCAILIFLKKKGTCVKSAGDVLFQKLFDLNFDLLLGKMNRMTNGLSSYSTVRPTPKEAEATFVLTRQASWVLWSYTTINFEVGCLFLFPIKLHTRVNIVILVFPFQVNIKLLAPASCSLTTLDWNKNELDAFPYGKKTKGLWV